MWEERKWDACYGIERNVDLVCLQETKVQEMLGIGSNGS